MTQSSQDLVPIWIPESNPWPDLPKDTYTACRGSFQVEHAVDAHIHFIGATWYSVWVDGEYLLDGPARYPKTHPEYDILQVSLSKGPHIIAVLVHYAGVSTRLLDNHHPFIACSLYADSCPIPISFRALRLGGYESRRRRTIETLGWAEFCDTRRIPAGWNQIDFNDSCWILPEPVSLDLGEFAPLDQASAANRFIALEPIAQGLTAEQYGYDFDDPPARFLFRDLSPSQELADGVWRRYDLGRVRLGKPRFTLDLPEGAVVEFGYCETMRFGRAAPFLGLGGSSCYMDRYIARGGRQEFMPLVPKGMRHLEVHIKADPSKVSFVEEAFADRGYHGEPEGVFECDDALLNRIWTMGVDTYRACAEDAIVDCPTRERGQWTGDIVNSEMQAAAAAYSDLRLVKRALRHAAWCSREDGLVAGLTPASPGYLTTYAAQWISGVYWYYQQTGDKEFLAELLPNAKANLAAFERNTGAEGFKNDIGWGFVDWGYKPNDGPVDIAVNLILLGAVRSFRQWLSALEEVPTTSLDGLETVLIDTSRGYLNGWDWTEIGYHRIVLAMREGLVPDHLISEAIEAIKRHFLSCFPNKPAAPRLSDPSVQSTQLITPYFANFAMPALIENGEFDFVLDQYRTCWGWALEQGLTTTPEVFDLRWSHCHAWSAAPTWQLTKYALGLSPQFDEGDRIYRLSLVPSHLKRVEGAVPTLDCEPISVRWEKRESAIDYRISTRTPITVMSGAKRIEVADQAEFEIAL